MNGVGFSDSILFFPTVKAGRRSYCQFSISGYKPYNIKQLCRIVMTIYSLAHHMLLLSPTPNKLSHHRRWERVSHHRRWEESPEPNKLSCRRPESSPNNSFIKVAGRVRPRHSSSIAENAPWKSTGERSSLRGLFAVGNGRSANISWYGPNRDLTRYPRQLLKHRYPLAAWRLRTANECDLVRHDDSLLLFWLTRFGFAPTARTVLRPKNWARGRVEIH
jgi:hypothetical protein